MVCRKERSEVSLKLVTMVLLPSASPRAGKSLPSVFHLTPSFWRVGTTQQNELLHKGTEQTAPPGDVLAFGPKSCVSPVAWHEAMLLLAQILTPARPCCFDFERRGGLWELRHCCPSPSHVASMPVALGLPRLVAEGQH